jgi:hypothetical protein
MSNMNTDPSLRPPSGRTVEEQQALGRPLIELFTEVCAVDLSAGELCPDAVLTDAGFRQYLKELEVIQQGYYSGKGEDRLIRAA